MKTSYPPTSLLRGGLVAACLLTTLPLQAQIIANFADGNTEEAVDGFIGKAGGGWRGEWEYRGYASSGSASAAVGSVTVVNDGTLWSGNRLKATPSNNATGTGISIGRSYGAEDGGIDLTKPISISFQFSFDDLGTFLSSSGNNVFIGENSANSGNRTTGTSWHIMGFGGNNLTAAPNMGSSSYNTARQGQWNIGNDQIYIPTGILLAEDVLYTFTISITPSNDAGAKSSYYVHLTDGTNTFTSDQFLFRSAQDLGRMLVFAETYTSTQGATYSIGNISISQIPEPSGVAFVLLGAGAAFGAAVLRKRSI